MAKDSDQRHADLPVGEKRVPLIEGELHPEPEVIGILLEQHLLLFCKNRWDGLTRFLEDGRIDFSTNAVERSMRPIALQRKNALFAGHGSDADPIDDLMPYNWVDAAAAAVQPIPVAA
jgi:transposase